MLEHVNAVLAQPLGHEDVEGVYAGLRPLLTGESEGTSSLSREHTVAVPVPGLVAVAGGKYTTYRVMARDAVDAAARGLDDAVPPSATDVTPLVGAEGYQVLWNGRRRLARESGLHLARIEHLLQRYGSRDPRAARRGRPAARSSASRSRAPRTTCASRSGTRRRTRARTTSTTCSPAARGSRSRRSTAGSPPPSRRRG